MNLIIAFIFVSVSLRDFKSVDSFVLISHSPIVGSSPPTTAFVCVDVSRAFLIQKLFVRRAFSWRGTLRLKAKREKVFGRSGFRYSWSRYPTNAVGAFQCGPYQNKITSYKMHPNGGLRAKVFSKLVTVGSNISLQMVPAKTVGIEIFSPMNITWRKNGRLINDASQRIDQGKTDGRTLSIKNVTSSDSGIYMAHYSNENAHLAAATIVIVRKCSPNKWSPDCTKVCPTCYNGGVCSVSNGQCVCPPGFTGNHCKKICPPNYFGRDCSILCSEITGVSSCRGVQVCQTTGCLCSAGWHGSNCDQPCAYGSYGASCTQTCTCNPGEVCDPQSGCSLIRKFPETFDNQDAKPPRLVNHPTTLNMSDLLTPEKETRHRKVSPNSPFMSSDHFREVLPSRRDTSLTVTKAAPGTTTATSHLTLPKPINPPFVVEKSATELVLGLNSLKYHGNGPIIARKVLFKRADESHFLHYNQIVKNDTIKITGLSPYTVYNCRVILYRPGGKTGIGPPGPVATIRTDCAVPTSGPKIVLAHAKNISIVYISWKNPSKEELNGRVLGYRIFCRQLGVVDDNWETTDINFGGATSVTIKQRVPRVVYEVKMHLRNCAGISPISNVVRVSTVRLDTPKGPLVLLPNQTSRSITMRWKVPSNAHAYTIMKYETHFKKVDDQSDKAVNHPVNTSEQYITFDHLQPFTSYTFRVRAFTHEGPGNFSDVISVSTLEEAPRSPLIVKASNVQTTKLTLTWQHPSVCNGIIRHYAVNMKTGLEKWRIIRTVGNETSMEITKLQEYTPYNFRVSGFTVKYGQWSDILITRTMSSVPLMPPVITNIEVRSPQSVFLTWRPPLPSPFVGNITNYKVIYTDDIRQNEQHWRSKIVSGRLRSLKIEGLRSDSVYFFKMAAKSERMGSYSKKATERTNKLGLPPPPFNERVFNVSSNNATICWSIAKGYRITVVKARYLNNGPNHITQLVEANENSKVLLAQLKPNTMYKVELIASNYIGDSSGNPILRFTTKNADSVQIDVKDEHPPSFGKTLILKVIIGALGGLVLIIIVIIVVVHYKCKSEISLCSKENLRNSPSQVEMDFLSTNFRASTYGSLSQGGPFISRTGTMLSCQSVHSGNSRAPSTHSIQIFPENLIIPWENILFEDIPLGVGNFGQVVKAVVQKDNQIIQVAVKRLKDGCTVEDKKDFLAELDTMVRIGHHKNIVTLVGACEHDNAMYLCTEFVSLGNLLQFLRKSRRIENETKTYTNLSQTQLLMFGYDVAQGMAYLSDKQIIHRDLAARNILLGEGHVCKIADFGLSRSEGVYVKRTVARLPIRWMAIESLNYNVYTSKSDVWSFGILLWEIVSLGGTPYCGMSCAELYDKLPTGYRMEKPLNCDDEVYAMMVQCWKDRPYDRPTFSQLCVALERMTDARCSRNYVNTAIFEEFTFANIDVTEEEG